MRRISGPNAPVGPNTILCRMGVFGREKPAVVEVVDKPLRCHVCEGDTFCTRKAVLPGTVATFLNFDWAAPGCTC